MMGVCVDYGSSAPVAVYVLDQAATSAECAALCPAGSQCAVVGVGEILPPEIDAAIFAEYMGAGFGIALVPLALVFGVGAVLRLIQGR